MENSVSAIISRLEATGCCIYGSRFVDVIGKVGTSDVFKKFCIVV